MDAATNGAISAIQLVTAIIANIIAFVSFVAFMNAIVSWLGILVGYDFITVEWIFGKLFIPLAYIIGIPWEDCEKVGAVIASKTIINEFIAYERLGALKKANAISVSLLENAFHMFVYCDSRICLFDHISAS